MPDVATTRKTVHDLIPAFDETPVPGIYVLRKRCDLDAGIWMGASQLGLFHKVSKASLILDSPCFSSGLMIPNELPVSSSHGSTFAESKVRRRTIRYLNPHL